MEKLSKIKFANTWGRITLNFQMYLLLTHIKGNWMCGLVIWFSSNGNYFYHYSNHHLNRTFNAKNSKNQLLILIHRSYWILYISRKLGKNICCEVFQFLFMGCDKKSLYHATEKKFLYASFDMMKNKVFVLVGLLFMFHEICHCQKKFSKLNLKANMSKESMTGLHQIVSCSYDKNIILKHIKSFVYSTKEWKTFYWQFFHT